MYIVFVLAVIIIVSYFELTLIAGKNIDDTEPLTLLSVAW